jgi:hypothetical protein
MNRVSALGSKARAQVRARRSWPTGSRSSCRDAARVRGIRARPRPDQRARQDARDGPGLGPLDGVAGTVELPGYGPLPADLLLSGEACTAWRRLIARDNIIIGGDSRQRAYTGTLATFIKARDGHRCAEPYCDAPIRHLDHIQRWADGGKTTFDNGRGLCEFHNHVRELKNWDVQRVGDTITTTTPTGAQYRYVIGTTARKPSTQRG